MDRCAAFHFAFSDAKGRETLGLRVGEVLTLPFRDARRFPSTRL
jgi:hypothetical protein